MSRKLGAPQSEYYEIFYCLENTIRELISNILKDEFGLGWWEKECVNPDIRKKVQQRKKKEIDLAVSVRSDYEIDFTTFGELANLIGGNWILFEPIFTSVSAVERLMAELNVLRGPIAHCCAISDHEQERLKFAVKNWLRIVA